MELSRSPLNLSNYRGLQTPLVSPPANPLVLEGLAPRTWNPSAPWAMPVAPAQTNSRCLEKGCVFPAAYEGRCLQHERQAREPVLFSSHQPTRVVLDQGRFDLPQEEIDTSRVKDRRKLAALREKFLEG
jgi:hypothetical protein